MEHRAVVAIVALELRKMEVWEDRQQEYLVLLLVRRCIYMLAKNQELPMGMLPEVGMVAEEADSMEEQEEELQTYAWAVKH
jgi:hypothetical protein